MIRTLALRSLVVAPTLALVGVGVTGCGADESVSAGAPASGPAGEVPAGVAEQYSVLEEEIAAEGGEITSGDWRITYIVEPAEAWFEDATAGSFREPAAGETHHIEVIPFEKATGRVVPDVPIRLEVIDSDGTVVDAKDLISLYGEFFHYAHNFSVPEDGTYTLRAILEPPTFGRHGEQADGPKLAEGATVEFEDVQLTAER